MKATKSKLGCVTAVCLLVLLPAVASAGGSFDFSVGLRHHSGHGRSYYGHHNRHSRHNVWVDRGSYRRGHGYGRSSRSIRRWRNSLRHGRSYGSTVWVKGYPAYREVEIYREPAVRHEVHVGSSCCGTVTRRVETYCR
jgi:hypothetical protein